MRSILLTILLIFLQSFNNTWAQKSILETSLSGFHFNSTYGATNGFSTIDGFNRETSVDISAGYFLLEATSVGFFFQGDYRYLLVNSALRNSVTGNRQDYIGRSRSSLGGAYVRYYFMLSEKFGGFGELRGGIGAEYFGATEEDSVGGSQGIITNEETRSLLLGGAGIGLVYSPIPQGAFRLGVSRDTRLETYDLAVTGGTTGIVETYSGFRVTLGVVLFLDLTGTREENQMPRLRR